jgi:hypothetical protein
MRRTTALALLLASAACGGEPPPPPADSLPAAPADPTVPGAQALRRERREGSRVHYAGTLRLSGRYLRRQDPGTLEAIGDQLCFFPDAASAGAIPRGDGDSRIPWFCFSDRDAALRAMSLPAASPPGSCGVEGTATVVVSGYVADLAVTSTFDTAKLDEVVRASAPVPVACPDG